MTVNANQNEKVTGKRTDEGAPKFPAAKPMPPDQIVEKRVVPASERINHKVLVVGQHAVLRSIIAESIGKMGYHAIETEILQAAKRHKPSEKPDVIIVDFEMLAGGTSAVEAAATAIRWLKEEAPDTKIIVLDGGYGKDVPDRMKALKDAGAEVVIDETSYGLEEAVEQLMPVSFSGKEPEKRATNGKTVLIVCEDKFLLDACETWVKQLGYDTLTALTYKDAVAKGADADVAIIDQGNEWECLEAIRAMKAANPAVKIFIRPELVTDPKDPRLKVATGLIPAIDGWGHVKTVLAEHLPLAAAPEKRGTGETTIHASPATTKKHATVLLVDDEYAVVEMLKAVVEEVQGYTAMTAANGAKGLEAYRKAFEAGNAPDVIVSDRQMPVMCGADMVREIKKLNPAAKVIFTTGYSNESDLIPLKAVKPFAILAKPIDITTFTSTVDQALSS